MEACESILLVKPEVFVYKIPPRTTNRGYRAADWNLQTPDWTGRMRLVAKGSECLLKLEDKNTGELFAKSPIDKYPGIAVEAVMDSSRYFVIRIQDDNGRAAFIGMGFADRGDSFDLNVALQDHFKWVEKTEQIEQEEKDPETKPQLDLSFKDGQTITINMKIVKPPSGGATPRSRPKGTGSGLLPPPPGGNKVGPPLPLPPVSATKTANAGSVDSMGLLLNLDSPSAAPVPPIPSGTTVQCAPSSKLDLWGEFATAEKVVAPPIAPSQKQTR